MAKKKASAQKAGLIHAKPKGARPRPSYPEPTDSAADGEAQFSGNVVRLEASLGDAGFTCEVELESDGGERLIVLTSQLGFQSLLELSIMLGQTVAVEYDESDPPVVQRLRLTPG